MTPAAEGPRGRCARFDLVLDPREVSPETIRPLRRGEYERLVALGAFDDEPVELLEGLLVQMTPHGPPHDGTIQRMSRVLWERIGQRADVRVQLAFLAGDASVPEPDLALVPRGDYDDAHPSSAFLVVEVAESSLAKDRGPKARIYAAASVPEYWVVDLVHRAIEVYSDPVDGRYRQLSTHQPGDSITLKTFPDVTIEVDSIVRPA